MCAIADEDGRVAGRRARPCHPTLRECHAWPATGNHGHGQKTDNGNVMTRGASRRREDVLRAIRDSRETLMAFGVARLSLFGSFARDEGRDDSDVDLLVEFNRPVGLFEFVRLQRQLAEIVGHRVDLVTPAALKPQLRERILGEAVIAA